MTRTFLLAAAVVLSSVASATAAPASGMLLGIYAFPNAQGLRVTGTMPEYSAHGKLFRNDVLVRVTADGVDIYSTQSFQQFEYAKDRIGPNMPAALEVFRPGQGYIYLWVEFIPVGGQIGVAAAMQARVMTEQQKPGAAQLFKRSRNSASPPSSSQPPRRGNFGRAANLFGR